MNHMPAQRRMSLSISPLMVIGIIFITLCAIESLLAARFWVQLATADAPEGIRALVLDASRPLVEPFMEAETAAEGVGSFERDTLVAAMVYLGAAVVLAVLVILAGSLLTGSEAMLRRQRRSTLMRFDQPSMDGEGVRLITTVSLPMSPEQATRALRILRLDRWPIRLFVIPAEGGTIVAAFGPTSGNGRAGPLSRLSETWQTLAVKRTLRRIGGHFDAQTDTPARAAD